MKRLQRHLLGGDGKTFFKPAFGAAEDFYFNYHDQHLILRQSIVITNLLNIFEWIFFLQLKNKPKHHNLK